MRPTEFSTDTIVALLRNQTIASLREVTAALGPGASRRTAFRRLKDLAARNSYSHRRGFYESNTQLHPGVQCEFRQRDPGYGPVVIGQSERYEFEPEGEVGWYQFSVDRESS